VVRNVFAEAKQRYGAPRFADVLPEYNIKTIAASLRRHGLQTEASRKFSPVGYPEHGLPVSAEPAETGFLCQWSEPEVGRRYHVSSHGLGLAVSDGGY